MVREVDVLYVNFEFIRVAIAFQYKFDITNFYLSVALKTEILSFFLRFSMTTGECPSFKLSEKYFT